MRQALLGRRGRQPGSLGTDGGQLQGFAAAAVAASAAGSASRDRAAVISSRSRHGADRCEDDRVASHGGRNSQLAVGSR